MTYKASLISIDIILAELAQYEATQHPCCAIVSSLLGIEDQNIKNNAASTPHCLRNHLHEYFREVLNEGRFAMTVTHYIQAATRQNTRLAYQSCIEHFESQWGGFLPATADSIANYLVHYADSLSINTLRQRLAALAAWHQDQGFPDPTKAPHVKKVLKGITALHPRKEKQAKPLCIEVLNIVGNNIDQRLKVIDNNTERYQLTRNKALFLLGFWRAFRSDELSRINIENVEIFPGKGMSIFLPYSKSDRNHQGDVYRAPALQSLCPVSAYTDWIHLANLKSGPLFRSINRWGHISEKPLNSASIIGIIRSTCQTAGLKDSASFSSHSLRRGFASWANGQQWDIKSLMNYVGWKDVQTAMRYIDQSDPFAQYAIEQSLTPK